MLENWKIKIKNMVRKFVFGINVAHLGQNFCSVIRRFLEVFWTQQNFLDSEIFVYIFPEIFFVPWSFLNTLFLNFISTNFWTLKIFVEIFQTFVPGSIFDIIMLFFAVLYGSIRRRELPSTVNRKLALRGPIQASAQYLRHSAHPRT